MKVPQVRKATPIPLGLWGASSTGNSSETVVLHVRRDHGGGKILPAGRDLGIPLRRIISIAQEAIWRAREAGRQEHHARFKVSGWTVGLAFPSGSYHWHDRGRRGPEHRDMFYSGLTMHKHGKYLCDLRTSFILLVLAARFADAYVLPEIMTRTGTTGIATRTRYPFRFESNVRRI